LCKSAKPQAANGMNSVLRKDVLCFAREELFTDGRYC
jgi:hypothetical protein